MIEELPPNYPANPTFKHDRKNKETVNVQGNQFMYDKENAIDWTKVGYKKREKILRYRYILRFRHVMKEVPTSSIDTQDKLAHFMRKNYGFGTFHVCFFSSGVKSKDYFPNFKCRKGCKIKAKNECKHNRIWTRGYVPRATVKIMPNKQAFVERDYVYEWIIRGSKGEQRDMMNKMWFWKGDVKEKKENMFDDKVEEYTPTSVAEEIYSVED